jgi:hypothetical protein
MITKEELKKIIELKNFTINKLGKKIGISQVLLMRKIHAPIENEIYHYANLNIKCLCDYLNIRRKDLKFNDYLEMFKETPKQYEEFNFNVGDIIKDIGEIKAINNGVGKTIIYLILNLNNEFEVLNKSQLKNKIIERRKKDKCLI